MKISVIVPVYNAQKTITQAVRSVLSQSYKEFELILVNDGSKDDSLSVLKNLESEDARIIVLSQENAGPGAARSKGVEYATGEYLFFMDADDYLPEDALESLTGVVMEHPYDVVRGLYYVCKGTNCEIVKYSWNEGIVNPKGKREEVDRYQKIKTSSSFGYLWGALYKKEFWMQHALSLAKIPLRFMEDTVFNLELFSYEPEYYVLCKPVYYYAVQSTGLSSDIRRDFWEQASGVVKEYCSFLKQNHIYEIQLDLLIPLAARCFSWASISCVTNQKVTLQQLKKKMKEFAEYEGMQEILQEKAMFKMLFTIANKAEAFVYAIFFLALKWKAYHILALIFVCLQTPMNAYIKSTLK
ncbi:MAG: glycosyltransferase family 2 protein [Agathobacter sp.]